MTEAGCHDTSWRTDTNVVECHVMTGRVTSRDVMSRRVLSGHVMSGVVVGCQRCEMC